MNLFNRALCWGLVPVTNPAYPATDAEIRREIVRLAGAPVELPRPVVIFCGYRAPSIQGRNLAAQLRRLCGAGNRFLVIAHAHMGDLARVVPRAVARVDAAIRGGDEAATAEVDVIGVSMGGLVAREAARAGAGRKRLAARRVFTLGTPHQGAVLAERIALDPAARAMRRGSKFLAALNADVDGAEHELVCYTRLRDRWVGATRAAPPGRHPIWTPGLLVGSHMSQSFDPRILADLARRLRGEAPLAQPSPPPCD